MFENNTKQTARSRFYIFHTLHITSSKKYQHISCSLDVYISSHPTHLPLLGMCSVRVLTFRATRCPLQIAMQCLALGIRKRLILFTIYVPGSKHPIHTGDYHPTFGSNRCINPYYWVDDHPLFLAHTYILLQSLGIQSPSENGIMEPKYLSFRRWLWQGDWIHGE